MKGKDLAVLGLLGIGAYVLLKKFGGGEGFGGGGGGVGGYTIYNIAPPITQPLTSVIAPVPVNYVDRPQLEERGLITPPTIVSPYQAVLSQTVVKSGTQPQYRPDQWWSQGPDQAPIKPPGNTGPGAGSGGGGAGTR